MFVTGFDQYANGRSRTETGRKYADLIVQKLEFLQLGIEFFQRLAQGIIEGIDRPAPFGGGMLDLAADLDHDGGLGHRFLFLTALFVDHPEAEYGEIFLMATQGLFHQQFKRGFSPLELVTAVLHLLDIVQNFQGDRIFAVQVDIEFLGLGQDIGAAGEIGDQHAGAVADQLGAHMFIGFRMTLDGADMHAPLVREGRVAHIGLMLVGGDVSQLKDIAGKIPQVAHLLVADALFFHLDLEGRDDRAEVGIAAALAETVDGSLDLHDTLCDGNHRVGHGTVTIVMGVNTERGLDVLLNLLDDFGQLEGHGAAIGVAEDDTVGLGGFGSLEGLDGVLGIGLVAVEEMLGVVEDFLGMLFQIFQRVEDQFEIFLQRDTQCLTDMKIPGLAEDGNGIRLGFDQGDDVVVLVRRHLGAAGGTKGRDLGLGKLLLLDILEKADILGVASRPAPFDILHTYFVKSVGDTDLILKQKRNILRLGTVTQGCVIQFYKAHRYLPKVYIVQLTRKCLLLYPLYRFFSTKTKQ